MSCMMSSPALLSALARTVEYIGNGRYDTTGMDLPRSLSFALADCVDVYGDLVGDKIYTKLYALNVAAYNGRYSDWNASEDAPDRPAGKRLLPVCVEYEGGFGGHFIVEPIHYDLARCLDFYIYQCSEDATYKSDLLQGMKELAHTVKNFIASNSAEYKKGEWGEV